MLNQLQFGMDGCLTDKVELATNQLKEFEPEEGYILAYSGGKDSQCAKKICELAGVKHETHYSVTTVDPPELVRFIISQFDTVIYVRDDKPIRMFTTHHPGKLLFPTETAEGEIIYFDLPEMPMCKLIPTKLMPPTRLVRYCCEILKEQNGMGRETITGVRRAESSNRKVNQGSFTVPKAGKKFAQELQNMGVNYTKTKRGGVVLNYDNSVDRRAIEACIRTGKLLINPIADWSEEDVWEFHAQYNIPHCSLYDEGFNRLGCVLCPMGGPKKMKLEMQRWPQYGKMYKQAFEKMLEKRKEKGLETKWKTADEVIAWWIGEDTSNNAPGMMETVP